MPLSSNEEHKEYNKLDRIKISRGLMSNIHVKTCSQIEE